MYTDALDDVATSQAEKPSCNIVPAGKRRDGKMRYWCLTHRADATGKYGVRARECKNSSERPISDAETLELKMDDFGGGIALWGAVPAVYDTTRLPMDRGIHVHGRRSKGDRKEIDQTFRAVRVTGRAFPEDGILISELEAIYYMVSSVFGFGTKLVRCNYCNYPHLDKDFFSVNPHRRHLCAGCGKHFFDSERAIGNPIGVLQAASGVATRQPAPPDRTIEIRQEDYPGGIQIWGSNAALLWTAEAREEEGIHLHAYKEVSFHPTIDDTYARVTVDGIPLDPTMIRILMAQRSMPSLAGRIVALTCDECDTELFELGPAAYTPSAVHRCSSCGHPINAKGRYRKVVPNPSVQTLQRLEQTAVRAIQQHSLGLLPEVL